jgi:hypothetical protein
VDQVPVFVLSGIADSINEATADWKTL